jgi:chromosome segregation ATPase
MTDQTTQTILQLVQRLATETDDLKSEIAGVKDILKQLTFRVHDLEAGVDRLDAGIDRLTARVDRIENRLRERRQSRSDTNEPPRER